MLNITVSTAFEEIIVEKCGFEGTHDSVLHIRLDQGQRMNSLEKFTDTKCRQNILTGKAHLGHAFNSSGSSLRAYSMSVSFGLGDGANLGRLSFGRLGGLQEGGLSSDFSLST